MQIAMTAWNEGAAPEWRNASHRYTASQRTHLGLRTIAPN